MENIEIKNVYTGKTMISGKYESMCDCVERNRAELNYAELNYARLNGAELNGARLNGARLNYAELNFARLNGARLNGARLNYAELNGAELNNAKLNYAELNYAELNGANWDFSAFPLWCGTFNINVCERLPTQLLYHIARMYIKTKDKDLLKLVNSKLFKKVANKFHRVEECGEIK